MAPVESFPCCPASDLSSHLLYHFLKGHEVICSGWELSSCVPSHHGLLHEPSWSVAAHIHMNAAEDTSKAAASRSHPAETEAAFSRHPALPRVPALLAAQTGSRLFPWRCPGWAHLVRSTRGWAVAPQRCKISDLRNPRGFSTSYSKQPLPLHPATKGMVLCAHWLVFPSCISAGMWVFPQASLPPPAGSREPRYSELPLDGDTARKSLRWDYKFNSPSTRK